MAFVKYPKNEKGSKRTNEISTNQRSLFPLFFFRPLIRSFFAHVIASNNPRINYKNNQQYDEQQIKKNHDVCRIHANTYERIQTLPKKCSKLKEFFEFRKHGFGWKKRA